MWVILLVGLGFSLRSPLHHFTSSVTEDEGFVVPASFRGKILKDVVQYLRTSGGVGDIPQLRSVVESTLGMSIKFFLVNGTITANSPVTMLALLLTDETSTSSPKNLKWSSVMNKSALWKVTFVFLVHIYSVCNLTDFFVRMFTVRDFAASSVASGMSNVALFLRANILAEY